MQNTTWVIVNTSGTRNNSLAAAVGEKCCIWAIVNNSGTRKQYINNAEYYVDNCKHFGYKE